MGHAGTLTIPMQPRWSPFALGHAEHTWSMVGKDHVEHMQAAVTSSPLTLTNPLATGTGWAHRYDCWQGSCGAQVRCGHQFSPHPDHPPAPMLVPLGTGICWVHRYGGEQGSCGAQASRSHQPDHPHAATLVHIETFSSRRLLH